MRHRVFATRVLQCSMAWIAIAVLLLPPSSLAQWQADGVPLTQTYGVQAQVLADGPGGCFAVWKHGLSNVAIYAQRLIPGGSLAPGWDPNGRRACGRGIDDYVADVISDGAGGWYVGDNSFVANTRTDPLLQRMGPDGLPSAGWPLDGFVVSSSPRDEGVSVLGLGVHLMAPDGSGGSYVAWWVTDGDSIRLSRVLPDATIAPEWRVPYGVIIGPPAIGGLPCIAPDDSGGVFVAWVDLRNGPGDIFCQRFHPDATLAPGWTTEAMPVCVQPNDQTYLGIAADRVGGAWIGWGDLRSQPVGSVPPAPDVYVARILPDATLAPGFPANGLAVAIAPNEQQPEDLESDHFGHAFLSWSDGRPDAPGAYLQRVQLDGTLGAGWPVNGIRVSTLNDATFESAITPDEAGGAFVAFTAYFTQKVYVQHVLGNGQVAPGWPPEGLPVTTFPGGQGEAWPAICSDGAGGCIAVWQDWRLSYPVIFAQHFDGLGPTPVQITLVRAEASPDRVRLEWYATEAGVAATVERRTASEPWSQLGETVSDGTGHLVFEDRSIAPGTRHAYRLVPQGGSPPSAETWVEVPRAEFALRGLVPNPAHGSALQVAFSLARSGPARIELLDLGGRMIAHHEEPELEAGPHALRPFSTGVPPGVYWLRLSQGAQIATARAVVLD